MTIRKAPKSRTKITRTAKGKGAAASQAPSAKPTKAQRPEPEAAALQHQLDSNRQEKLLLRQQLVEANSAAETARKALEAQHAKQKKLAKKDRSLEQQLDELRQALQDEQCARQQLESKQTDLDARFLEAANERLDLREKFQAAQEANRLLQEKWSCKEVEKLAMSSELAKLRLQLESCDQFQREAEAQYAETRRELKATHEKLVAQSTEYQSLTIESQGWKSQKNELQLALQNEQIVRQQIEDHQSVLIEQLAQVEGERKNLGEQFLEAQTARLKIQQQWERSKSENGELREQIESIQRTQLDVRDQLQTARTACQKLTAEQLALQQQLLGQSAELDCLRETLRSEQAVGLRLAADRDALQANLEAARLRNIQLEDQLTASNQEKQELAAKLRKSTAAIQQLEEQGRQLLFDLESSHSAHRLLEKENSDLVEKAEAEKRTQALGWTTDLAPVLASLASLANLEPVPVRNLTPRAVYEELLDWMEKKIGERPRAFPAKSEVVDGALWLDPDSKGIENLLREYNWAPERPFEGLPQGQRRLKFQLLRRGWRVEKTILERARVALATDAAAGDNQ